MDGDEEIGACLLTKPIWRNDLTPVEVERGTAEAKSILQFVAITRTKFILDDVTINKQSRMVLDAIIFLSQNDMVDAVRFFSRVIRSPITDNYNLKLEMTSVTFSVAVVNSCAFRAIIELAVVKAIPLVRDNPDGKIILIDILLELVGVQWKACHYLIYKLKAIHAIRTNTSCIVIQNVLFKNLMLAMNLKPLNIKIIGHSVKLVDMLVKYMSSDEKRHLLEIFEKIDTWGTGDCYFVMYLIKYWPANQEILNVNVILDHICALLENNAGPAAMRLLNVFIPHIQLITWTTKFIPDVLKLMPSNEDECRSFVRSTLLECTSIAVKHFGRAVLDSCQVHKIDLDYSTVVLWCCVQQDYVNINEYKNLVECLLKNPRELIQYYAMKALCHINNKSYKIEEWHLTMVQLYFNNVVNASTNFDGQVFGHFLSHICVHSNYIIKEEAPDSALYCKLLVYDRFIAWLYFFCIENLESRDQRLVSIGANIFNLVYEIITESSTSLKTKYNLSRDNEYEYGQSPFFNHLKSVCAWHFGGRNTAMVLVHDFISSPKVFPEIPNIVKKWFSGNLDDTKLDMFFKLGLFILKTEIAKESIEKGRCVIDIVLNAHEQDRAGYTRIIQKLYDYWHSSIGLLNLSEPRMASAENTSIALIYCINDIFEKGHFEMADNTQLLQMVFEDCIMAIHILLSRCRKNVGPSDDLQIAIKRKSTEQLIILCLDTISFIVKKSSSKHFLYSALNIANDVMLANSGRSTIATAAGIIHRICGEILAPSTIRTNSNDQQQVIIIQFLECVLNSIYTASEDQTSNIRRSPEYRLVIHSIVSADQLPNHPYLVRAMNFLLGLLSNPSSSSSAIAATLHTMETLVVDNTIRYSTFPFISAVAIHCIKEFSSSNWKIKNAAIQVLQGLVIRILGPACNALNRRRTTVEEIFLLYPKLAVYFYSKLRNFEVFKESHGSIIAVLALFSESHSKLSVFLNDDMNFIISCFGQIFVRLICTETGIAGIFAAKAYSAIYPHSYIPIIIGDVVGWLQLNFENMNKNTFYSVLCLLRALYEKFNLSPKVFYFERGLCIIHSVFQRWLLFLEQFNYKYEFSLFSLLAVKSNRLSKSEETIFNHLQKSTYQSRLWLHNNIPYVLHNIDIHQFPIFLMKCFRQPLLLSILKHFLNGILIRYDELVENSLTSHVLMILIDKFFEMHDMCSYLVCSFSHTILLLLESCTFIHTKDFITKLRCSYNTVNDTSIYTLAVYVALLSYYKEYSDEDQVFIKDALAIYKDAALIEDPELQLYIASTLKYLYKCVEVPDRHHLFKVAFILLLNRDTGLEICKFVSVSFQVAFCSIYATLNTLISVEHLRNQLGTTARAIALLVDLTLFTSSLSDVFEDCGEFYMKQNSDICSHKSSVTRILLEQVKVAFALTELY